MQPPLASHADGTPDIAIRSFSPTDYPEVIRLWQQCHLTVKASDSLSELEKLCAEPHNCFLLAHRSAGSDPSPLLGTIIGAFGGRRGWIYHLGVIPAARRNGIASRLLRAAENHLRAHGASKINLLVEPENPAAISCYQSQGFTSIPLTFLTKVVGD